jgi:hypothetical protein
MPKDLVIFFTLRGRPKYRAKQAAPGNYRTRCLVPSRGSGILDALKAPINLASVETFPGAASLTRGAVIHALRKISSGLLRTAQSGSPPFATRPPCRSWIIYLLLATRLLAPDPVARRPRVWMASANRGEKACPQLIRKQLR